MNIPLNTSPNAIPNDEYHNGEKYRDFVSSTTLKQMLVSPLWMKYCKEHPEEEEEKSWATFGNCYHSMLSSIANTGDLTEFNSNVAVFEPPVNKGTGKPYGATSERFKMAYEGFLQNNPGKEIYSQQDIDHAEAMIKHLRNGNPHLSPIVNKLLKIGKGEISIFVEHKANDMVQYDTGMFKIRKDLTTYNKIIDWKTTRDDFYQPDKFAKEIIDKGYDFSAAFYQYIEWLVTGRWKQFFWVVQSKSPPYSFSIIEAANWAFEVIDGQYISAGPGAKRMLMALDLYLYCREKDDWPDWSIFESPGFKRISRAQVPHWYANQKTEYYF